MKPMDHWRNQRGNKKPGNKCKWKQNNSKSMEFSKKF